MPQLDRALVKERAARLRATGLRLHQSHLDSMVGTQQWLLVENNGLAHTENFTAVAVPGLTPRTFVQATITGHNGKHLCMSPKSAKRFWDDDMHKQRPEVQLASVMQLTAAA